MTNVITRQSPLYAGMLDKISSMEKGVEVLLSGNHQDAEKWINGGKVCRMLHISKRTLQNYRDNGILPYSMVGGKIYYNTDDIENLMQKNYVASQ